MTMHATFHAKATMACASEHSIGDHKPYIAHVSCKCDLWVLHHSCRAMLQKSLPQEGVAQEWALSVPSSRPLSLL